MIISIIVAATNNHVIGNKGIMPWHLPDDLRYFRQITLHHPIIMGRKTFESIGLNKPLPKRTNIIISRNKDWQAPEGCLLVHSLEQALAIAQQNGETEAFIIGGAQIYREAMPLCQRIYLTQIASNLAGDAFFSAISPLIWREVSSQYHPKDDKHAYEFWFKVYERK